MNKNFKSWEELDIQSTPWVSTCRNKFWVAIKQTTRRLQSWRRNRLFIGINLWPEVIVLMVKLIVITLLENCTTCTVTGNLRQI